MSYNNKSIHILRGTGTDDSVKNTVLEKGQPFYDKADHSLKIGQEGNNTTIANTPRVTSGAVVLDHALTSNLSIYTDGNNIIIKNTGSGHKVQINSPTTEITGNLLPSADGKNIGASNNKFNGIYTSNLLSSSISTSTVAVGEYASISINTGDPDHPNLIIQTGGAEGDITLQSNRYINLNNPSTIHGTLNVIGMSTLNGIDNGSDGISNAGAVSGVTTLTTSNTATIGGNIVPASSSAQGTGKLIGTTSNRWTAVNANQIHTQSIEGQNSGWTSNPWSISQEGNIRTDGHIDIKEVDYGVSGTTLDVGTKPGVYVIWGAEGVQGVEFIQVCSTSEQPYSRARQIIVSVSGPDDAYPICIESYKEGNNYKFKGVSFEGYCPLIYFHDGNNNIENNTASSGSGGNNQAPGGSGTNVPQ